MFNLWKKQFACNVKITFWEEIYLRIDTSELQIRVSVTAVYSGIPVSKAAFCVVFFLDFVIYISNFENLLLKYSFLKFLGEPFHFLSQLLVRKWMWNMETPKEESNHELCVNSFTLRYLIICISSLTTSKNPFMEAGLSQLWYWLTCLSLSKLIYSVVLPGWV